jgi:hypothetical protein
LSQYQRGNYASGGFGASSFGAGAINSNAFGAGSINSSAFGSIGAQNVGASTLGTSFGAGSFGVPVTSQYRGIPQKSFQSSGSVQSSYGQQRIGSAQFQSNQFSNFRPAQSGFSSVGSSQFANQSQFGAGHPSTQSYHSAQYRGNQQDHDTNLRADSFRPTNAHTGFSSGASNVTTLGASNAAGSFGAFTNAVSPFSGGQNQAGGFQSTQSYHTAQYRGNQ